VDFRKHWDNWGWIIPAGFIVIAFARFMFGREPFCAASAEEHCLREWVSATAGWGGIAVATMSFLYLAKQVKDAERFFRASAKLQILGETNTTRHLRILSKTMIAQMADYVKELKTYEGADPQKEFADILGKIKYLRRVVSREEFLGINQRYATFQTADSVLERIDWFIEAWPNGVDTAGALREARDKAIEGPIGTAASFAEELREGCDEWIANSKQILDLD
jgi:hypothetical protein